MRNKYFITTLVLSNLFFWMFLALGVMNWLDNREAKVAADFHYQEMQAVSAECVAQPSTDNDICRQMGHHRTELEKFMLESAHYDSLTRLFLAFAFFLPLITWVSYFLTRAIFR